ncbi:MAG TPA: DUF1015 domain-containing protein, partial [Ktedonobacterales bacterium]|nr:DUF1015 domain-containing protein [Ktedonobacterales bacterium]
MADVRPFPALRYAPGANLAAVVTPPYDVISPAAQAGYYARDPHNIIRLELGREAPGDDELANKYTRAAAEFADWRRSGILRQDQSAYYLYEQTFSATGRDYRKLSLLARVRLEPWEAGVVLPHERTMSKPKQDRLALMRATSANLSPLMVLYDDPASVLAARLAPIAEAAPTAAFTDEASEGHRLWLLDDPTLAGEIGSFFRERQLYIADGHHRYETALTYRDEQAALRKEPLPADDPLNFTLMALSAIEDPGLVVLPTHRILRDLDATRLAALDELFPRFFDMQSLTAADAGEALARLAEAGSSGARAFVLVRPEGLTLLRLNAAGRAAMDALDGEYAEATPAWRQ